jgi:hypothetical protein
VCWGGEYSPPQHTGNITGISRCIFGHVNVLLIQIIL